MAEPRNLIRIANTDIDTKHHVLIGLSKIKGVNIMLSNALCRLLNLPTNKKVGELNEKEIETIEKSLENPEKLGIPSWMFNRRRDIATGEDKHVIGTDLKLTQEDDLKTMKKIKSYKGLRHQWGLTVRGQRTQSNFRKKASKKRK